MINNQYTCHYIKKLIAQFLEIHIDRPSDVTKGWLVSKSSWQAMESPRNLFTG